MSNIASLSHSSPTRPYDLILFGATGFTGRYAFKELKKRLDSSIKWGIAGRNRDQLNQLAQETQCGVIIADGTREDELADLCKQTRIVISTAGPFSLYSDLLVEQCVIHQTHYLDLTGETPWIRSLIDRFHQRARDQGTLIVPACGFDSIPSDLGTWALWQWTKEQNLPLKEVDASFALQGGLNGGTLASALHLSESGQNRLMGKRLLLCPTQEEHISTFGPLHSLPTQPKDPRNLCFDSIRQQWKVPFFMGQINTRIVRRSACFLGYGESFQYQEWMRASSRFQATCIGLGLTLLEKSLASSFGRRCLRVLGPNPGQGPSSKHIQNGWMNVDFINRDQDKLLSHLKIKAQGDPGNLITVRCLIASAQTLLMELEKSERLVSGVITPSMAFGDQLFKRLIEYGWEIQSQGKEISSWFLEKTSI